MSPNLKRWYTTLRAREALQRGLGVGKDWKKDCPVMDEMARKVPFGQTAASTARR